ncbi:MAG: hypothetical protein AAF430_18945 [Myxococcota bacterium]
MKRSRQIEAMGLALLLLCGACASTAPLPESRPITISEGLTRQNVEVAIISALTNRPPPEEYDPRLRLDDETFKLFIWKHYIRDSGRAWMVERRDPGAVTAAIIRREYYLQVRVDYGRDAVNWQVTDSRGLDRENGRINRRAADWLEKLDLRLRHELGRMAYF